MIEDQESKQLCLAVQPWSKLWNISFVFFLLQNDHFWVVGGPLIADCEVGLAQDRLDRLELATQWAGFVAPRLYPLSEHWLVMSQFQRS